MLFCRWTFSNSSSRLFEHFEISQLPRIIHIVIILYVLPYEHIMYIAAAYMNTFYANIHCNFPIELLYLMVNVFYVLPGMNFEYMAVILILLSIFWNSIVNTWLLNLSHNKQQATIFCIVMSCNIMCISIISTAFYGKLILLKSSYQTKFITQSYLIQPS